MRPSPAALVFVAVAAVGIGLGLLAQRLWDTPAADQGAVVADGVDLLAASLPDLAGRPQALAQWRGKVVVVNFWATWCEPCREEIPDFIAVQTAMGARGVQVLGLAVDDPEKVRPYAARMQMNYPVLTGEMEGMDLARQAGNVMGGLPFTVILDRSGRVVKSHAGRLTRARLEAMLATLL